MLASVTDQVIDFYYALFEHVFFQPFRSRITERLRRNAVQRQVFELPRRVTIRLNQISGQLDTLGRTGQDAADERYELTYGDYLLQRFHRVEAGTVRMTTNLAVDIRELFVMPHVHTRSAKQTGGEETADAAVLMKLAEAREFFGGGEPHGPRPELAITCPWSCRYVD